MYGFIGGGWYRSEDGGRNSRVSTTSPRILRSDVVVLVGKGDSIGVVETTHLSAGAGRGAGRSGVLAGWQTPPSTAQRGSNLRSRALAPPCPSVTFATTDQSMEAPAGSREADWSVGGEAGGWSWRDGLSWTLSRLVTTSLLLGLGGERGEEQPQRDAAVIPPPRLPHLI